MYVRESSLSCEASISIDQGETEDCLSISACVYRYLFTEVFWRLTTMCEMREMQKNRGFSVVERTELTVLI